MPTDQLTALRTINGEPATKRHVWSGDGWRTQSYSGGQYFAWSQAPVGSIDELHQRLTSLESQPEWFVIRGEPLCGAKYLRRTYKGDSPHFEPADRQWLCIDIDDLPAPKGANHVECAIQSLPVYFHDIACHWQHTSSAGFTGAENIRLHLWYWLDRPVCDFSLREWAKATREGTGIPIDAMLYNPVQPHYTANPIIEGAPDPIAVRSGLREGGPCLTLPLEVLDLNSWVEKQRGERAQAQTRRARQAQRARVNPNAESAKEAYALAALNSACERIESARKGDRHRLIFNQAAAVGELLPTGHLDETQARVQLEEAALIAIADEGRQQEAVRTVADGLEEGRKRPRDLSHVGGVDLPPQDDSQPDEGWLDRHQPITCNKFDRAATGCAHYLDCGACALESEFMCVEWLKINPPRSGTNHPPRSHWSTANDD